MLLRILTVCLLLPALSAGQERARRCKHLEAGALAVTRDAPGPAAPEIRVRYTAPPDTAHLELSGPVLGSMDSPDVRVNLSCTATGIAIMVHLERSEFYQGAAGKNVLWRPLVSLDAALRKPQATVQVRWMMRLSNGKAVGRTPAAGAGPQQTYPITLSRILKREER